MLGYVTANNVDSAHGPTIKPNHLPQILQLLLLSQRVVKFKLLLATTTCMVYWMYQLLAKLRVA